MHKISGAFFILMIYSFKYILMLLITVPPKENVCNLNAKKYKFTMQFLDIKL